MQVTHVRLLVRNFRECFRFYRDVLGLETHFPDDDGPYAEFLLGGDKYLGLFDRAAMADAIGATDATAEPGADRVALVINVDDADKAEENLRVAGVPIVATATDRPDWGLRTVHVRDPDGTLIELWSPYTGGEG